MSETGKSKWLLYSIIGLLFGCSLLGMLFYGYKTFYIEPGQAETREYTYHFALIAEESDNEYWRMIEKGAREIAEENDIYLEFVAPQKADNDQSLTLLDRMISSKADGIITQGIQGPQFKDLVHKGIERGIPILTIDTDVEDSERKAYVGSNNLEAGRKLGEAFLNQTSGEQHVGIIAGRFDSINQQERIKGFKEAVGDKSDIHIAAIEESNITVIGASKATYSLLKRNPKINSLVGMSAMDGIGIVEGVQEITPNKDIFIATFDVLPETIQLINEGDINFAIAQYPEEMGQKAVQVMMELQEKDLLDKQQYTGTKIITRKDLDKHSQGITR